MYTKLVNRILLGLLMLVPGLIKLFYMGSDAVTGMLSGMGFPAPAFFAWVLILSEIVFGLAILARWKLHYTVWPPIVIMLVAAVLGLMNSGVTGLSGFLLHLVAASAYFMLGGCWCCGMMGCNDCACSCCDTAVPEKSVKAHHSKHKKR